MKRIQINLKDLRKSQDLTQQKLAEQLGISRQSVIAVEAGRFLPSIELAMQIAEFFNTSIDELIGCENYQLRNKLTNQTLNIEEENMSPEHRFIKPFGHIGEADDFRQAMDKLVEDFFGEENSAKIFFPRVEICQKGNVIIAKCEVPGTEPDSIDISIEDDHLTIEGERKSDEIENDEEFYTREIHYGHFSRIIPLPKKVDANKTTAKFKNGLLIITAPLMQEKKLAGKKIKVETEN